MKREQSSASLAAQALEEAEDALEGLPDTTSVRKLQARLAPLKTVLVGIVREQPRLTDTQEARLASDAIRLARDAIELRARLLRPEE
jgi:hypothetical protein